MRDGWHRRNPGSRRALKGAGPSHAQTRGCSRAQFSRCARRARRRFSRHDLSAMKKSPRSLLLEQRFTGPDSAAPSRSRIRSRRTPETTPRGQRFYRRNQTGGAPARGSSQTAGTHCRNHAGPGPANQPRPGSRASKSLPHALYIAPQNPQKPTRWTLEPGLDARIAPSQDPTTRVPVAPRRRSRRKQLPDGSDPHTAKLRVVATRSASANGQQRPHFADESHRGTSEGSGPVTPRTCFVRTAIGHARRPRPPAQEGRHPRITTARAIP